MSTLKNCHSPAGMNFFVGCRLTNLIDCPGCKFGTLDYKDGKEETMKCADCGREYKTTDIIKPKDSK